MSFCRLAVVIVVLMGVVGSSNFVRAQGAFVRPPAPVLTDAREEQEVLRPPRGVGPDESDVTGTIRPQSLTAMPPEIRPEVAPETELPAQFRRTLVDYRTTEGAPS